VKRIVPVIVLAVAAIGMLDFNLDKFSETSQSEAVQKTKPEEQKSDFRVIEGVIESGETLYSLFKRYSLDTADILKMREASASVHKLRYMVANRPYKLIVDEHNRVQSFEYTIDDTFLLSVARDDKKFTARKIEIPYERRTGQVTGVINDNLISSMGEGKENLRLALDLSDILAWDVDFTSDIRVGDSYKVIVEELHEGGQFRKYGNILAVEFINNGMVYKAFRFENNGKADYFDENGHSLRKAFLKAPLSFRRISSGYSKGRFHPVLKKYRPHHGIDYAAATGTPVSAIGDGTVIFAGKKGDYGKLIIVKHANGYKSYYGHLSRFGKSIKGGVKVAQGQTIAAVGSTGLATGPHLHFEMRVNNRPVNPVSIRTAKARPVPAKAMGEFMTVRARLAEQLDSIPAATAVASGDSAITDKRRSDGV